MSLSIGFIGCVGSSRIAFETLLALPPEQGRVVGLITRRASKYNADFIDLTPLAALHRCPTLYADETPSDQAQAAWMAEFRPDLIFCVGWSRLLGTKMLSTAHLGTIGFHPAALPANRGRHPLIWALALGLEQTASTFFVMDDSADSGPIAHQLPLSIAFEDDAATLYAKVLAVIPDQIRHIVAGLADSSLIALEQDHSLANHWRKRGPSDGLIDWRMSARSIYNLVRALTRPYPGADFVHQGQTNKLWRCEIVSDASANLEPGRVLAVEGRTFIAKCGEGALRVLDHDMVDLPSAGAYL